MPSNVFMTSSIKTSTDEIINLIIGDKWTEQVLSSTIINPRGGDKFIFYKESTNG